MPRVRVIDRWWYNEKYINTMTRLIHEDIEANFSANEK